MINHALYALGAQPNPIRTLFEYGLARSAEVGPENVFDFTLGNPSIPTPRQVTDQAARLLEGMDSLALHGYTSSVGALDARAAIAEDLNRRFGAQARAEELFLTCGAAPALTAVLRALAVPQGEVVAIAPFFMEYKAFAQAAGLRLRVVQADIPAFQIRLDWLEEALTPHTQAVLLNSPNNPTGRVYTRATLEALAALLNEKSGQYGHPIYLISDEPYRELVYDGVEVPFVPGIYPHTVICYSYSKSLSLPGERIGYVYVPGSAADCRELYLAVAGAARSCGHVCAPSLWQKVLARCAGVGPELEAYDRNRRLLYGALTDMGYCAAKPDGAFYLFVRAPEGDSEAFCRRAMKQDLLVVPGTDFGCREYFRISYAVPYDKIRHSLPIFRRLLEEDSLFPSSTAWDG